MPQAELLPVHRKIIARIGDGLSVRRIKDGVERVAVASLHDHGYVQVQFDWMAFDTVLTVTDEGRARIADDVRRERTVL